MSKRYGKYAKIAVDAPIFDLFDYGIPPEYEAVIAPGWRVMVPLGRRLATGFIIELTDKPDYDIAKIKPIADVPDDEAVLTPELLNLCKFVSDYYIAPLGETIARALPLGVGIGTKQVVYLIDEPEHPEDISQIERKIISLLRDSSLPLKKLSQKIGRKGAMYHVRKLERRGFVGRKYEYRIHTPPKTVEIAYPAPDISTERIDQLESNAPNQAGIMRYLIGKGPTRATYLRKIFGSGSFKSLVEKEFIRLQRHEVLRSSEGWLESRKNIEKLTGSQEKAIAQLKIAIKSGKAQNFLIHGVTGSGKTLVYLEAARVARQLNRGVLVLVPEVALTPQMWGALREYFGEEVAVLHSYLSPGERADAWRKLRRGEVHIALGARSAVFAPVKELGLIVIDEEHEGSYKQGKTPYYSARNVALIRGKIENAIVILGSATPSLESYYNALTGKFKLLEMPERVPGTKLPEVKVIDIRKLRYEERMFSPLAKSQILGGIERGEQSILLLNRRGFSTNIICPECGYIPLCPNCELTLTYHRVGDDLRCHWCDYRTPAPDSCPNCNTDSFKHRGKGTQKIETQLYDFVEPEQVLRIDSDAIERKGALNKILERFAAQESSVLVGTQMVAKGHDFPNVTLVVVIDADTGLSIPDFRAGEKTFQLLSQVSGRAGRGEKPGLVIIQTRHPDEPAVRFAIAHDFKSFFKDTLARRQILKYPPYARLVRILARSKESEKAESAIRRILNALIKEELPDVNPLSPTKPPLAKLKGEYRWHLLIKIGQIARILPFLRRVAKADFKNVKIRIDVDPYEMM